MSLPDMRPRHLGLLIASGLEFLTLSPFENLQAPIGFSWTFQDLVSWAGLWHVAFSSVRQIISVSLLVRVQSPGPLPGDVRAKSKEAYAKVTCQDLTDY